MLVGNYGTQTSGSGGGGGGITSIPVGNTLYVDVDFGDDATALPNRFDKPYLTISAAVTAASSGDLINIHAGSYTISSNIAKDGVNFYAEEGVNLTCLTTPFNYDTTIGGTTATVPSYFMGYAKILFCSTPLIITRTNPLVNFTCELDNVFVGNLSNGVELRDGLVYLNIRNDYTVPGRCFSLRDTGSLVARIGGTCTTTFANIFNGIFWISGTNWTGQADIKAKTFVLPTTVLGSNWTYVYCDNLVGFNLRIELEYLTDTSANTTAMIRVANAFSNTAVSYIFIDIKKIELSNRPLFDVNVSQTRLYLNGDIVTDCNGATLNNGVVNLNFKNVLTSSAFNLLTNNSTFILLNSFIFSTSGGTPFVVTTGTLILLGSYIESDDPSFENTSGRILSFGSGGGVLPTGQIRGEFNVNGVYYENTVVDTSGGVSQTIPDFTKNFYVDPAAPIANYEITMPNAIDGQEVKISFGGTITTGIVVTSLTIVGNTGQTVLDNGAITNAIAGDGYIFKFEANTGIWRIF